MKHTLITTASIVALAATTIFVPINANADSGKLDEGYFCIQAKNVIHGQVGKKGNCTSPEDVGETIRYGKAHINGRFQLVGEGWDNRRENVAGGFNVLKNGEEIYSYENNIFYGGDVYAYPWYDLMWVMDGENEYTVEFFRGDVSWTIPVNDFHENWRTDDGVNTPYVDVNPGVYGLQSDGTFIHTPAA